MSLFNRSSSPDESYVPTPRPDRSGQGLIPKKTALNWYRELIKVWYGEAAEASEQDFDKAISKSGMEEQAFFISLDDKLYEHRETIRREEHEKKFEATRKARNKNLLIAGSLLLLLAGGLIYWWLGPKPKLPQTPQTAQELATDPKLQVRGLIEQIGELPDGCIPSRVLSGQLVGGKSAIVEYLRELDKQRPGTLSSLKQLAANPENAHRSVLLQALMPAASYSPLNLSIGSYEIGWTDELLIRTNPERGGVDAIARFLPEHREAVEAKFPQLPKVTTQQQSLFTATFGDPTVETLTRVSLAGCTYAPQELGNHKLPPNLEEALRELGVL